MGKGIIDSGDMCIVFNQVVGVEVVGMVGYWCWVEVEFLLQWGYQCLYDILIKVFILQNNVVYFWDDDGVEYQWVNICLLIDGVDLFFYCLCVVDVFYKWQGYVVDGDWEL